MRRLSSIALWLLGLRGFSTYPLNLPKFLLMTFTKCQKRCVAFFPVWMDSMCRLLMVHLNRFHANEVLQTGALLLFMQASLG